MSVESNPWLVRVRDLTAGYGRKQILRGINLDVAPGEIVAIVGHNGAGKTTLLRAMFGLLPIWSGTVVIQGVPQGLLLPHDLLKLGVVFVPQGNRVFGELTVRENFQVVEKQTGSVKMENKLKEILDIFPALKKLMTRTAGTLSGGEKQILALSRALLSSPRLLLLDEPSLGLAPSLTITALEHLRMLNSHCGISILVVEQKVREVLKVANRIYVLRNGQVSFSGPTLMLAADNALLRKVYL